jgi:Acyl-CoA carboxylase epsilon subunit
MIRTPVIRIGGNPSEDELAALIVVLAALMNAALTNAALTTAAGPPAPRSSWADPARALHAAPRPGPGAWRGSSLP